MKRASNLRHALWLLLILAVASPANATNNLGAQEWDPQQNGIYNYSPRYYYPDGSVPTTHWSGNCRSRVSQGAGVWNAENRELRFASGTGFSKWIKVKMADLSFPNNDDYAFAYVDVWGDVSSADINFNSDVDLANEDRKFPYCGTGTPPVDYYDYYGVATHEFGHTIVLNHSTTFADTMYHSGTTCGCSDAIRWRTLTTHDRDGIDDKYAAAQ